MMVRLCERYYVRSIAARWDAQYAGYPEDSDKFLIGEKLRALNVETGTCSMVEEIIGNLSWTGAGCSECEARFVDGVRIGDEPDWESRTVYLCDPCLDKLVQFRDSGGAK